MNLFYEIISILIIFFSKAFFIFIVLLIHDSKTSVPLKDLQHPEKIEPIQNDPKTREELKEQMLSKHTCPCGYLGWQMSMFCDDRGCKYCIHFEYEYENEYERLNF